MLISWALYILSSICQYSLQVLVLEVCKIEHMLPDDLMGCWLLYFARKNETIFW